MPLERATLTRGDREVRSSTRTFRATWVSPKGQGKRRKSFSIVKKKLVNAPTVAFTVKVLPFSRATDRNCIAALKRKSQSINSLPYYSRNEI